MKVFSGRRPSRNSHLRAEHGCGQGGEGREGEEGKGQWGSGEECLPDGGVDLLLGQVALWQREQVWLGEAGDMT